MVNYFVKAICGFREDQEYSIPLNEAHKLYRLFDNPNERAMFSNGLALIGSDIRRIVPDEIGTMGWSSSHKLDSDDWNEIRSKGVDRVLRDGMYKAKEIAKLNRPELLTIPLDEAIKQLPEQKKQYLN